MSTQITPASGLPFPADARVATARYVLFGRILPVLRHALVGELQAMKFGVTLARISVEAGTSRSDGLDAIARLGEQTGRAIARSEAITRWFQPDIDATIVVADAVEECLELVRTEWQMRGFEVSTRVAAGEATVKDWPFREVLAAALITMGDAQAGPADVMLRARSRRDGLVLSICCGPATREGEAPRHIWPGLLHWSDVDTLARAHGIAWVRRGNRLTVRFPLIGVLPPVPPRQPASGT
jgi:hypothetical protein